MYLCVLVPRIAQPQVRNQGVNRLTLNCPSSSRHIRQLPAMSGEVPAGVVVAATSMADPGMEAVDDLNLANLDLINRAVTDQIVQMGVNEMIHGRQQRQLAILTAVRRDAVNLSTKAETVIAAVLRGQ